MKYSKYYPYIIIALLGVLLLMRECNGKSKLQEQVSIYESLNDTLQQTKNKLGQQVTKTSILESENKNLFLGIKSSDSVINSLQTLVKEYKGKLDAALIANTITSDTGVSGTTIIGYDTINIRDTIKIYPVYYTSWSERWSSGWIKATKDSISRYIRVSNKYKFTLGKEKYGFLGLKKRSMVTMVNENPNTLTQELKVFRIDNKPSKFGIGVFGGYGIGLDNLKPSGVIGIGVYYSLIRL